MFGKKKHNRRTGDIVLYGADGDALGIVFRDVGDFYWYAISYATQHQVGGGFATQEDAETALRESPAACEV